MSGFEGVVPNFMCAVLGGLLTPVIVVTGVREWFHQKDLLSTAYRVILLFPGTSAQAQDKALRGIQSAMQLGIVKSAGVVAQWSTGTILRGIGNFISRVGFRGGT